MLFPTLRRSSLPLVVAQPDERHANRTVSMLGVVWRTLVQTENSDSTTTKMCCFSDKGRNKNQWRHYVTSEEWLRYDGKSKTFIYNYTINAKNWLLVYHLPTNLLKTLRVLSKKCYYNVISSFRRCPIFCQIYA